jgi:hypothetical protein
MPKTSKETVSQVQAFELAEDRAEDLGGYTVDFVTIHQTHDLVQALSGLPGGQCHCPHWGYVFKGRTRLPTGTGRKSSALATRSICRQGTSRLRSRAASSSSSARLTSSRSPWMPSTRPCRRPASAAEPGSPWRGSGL